MPVIRLHPSGQEVPYPAGETVLAVLELRLRPLGRPLRFWPGQYVMLGDAAGEVPARAYSIANAPQQDGELTLQVSRLDGGATSRWVHESLQPGDRLRLAGPYGTFIGDPSVETPVLCLAAGSVLAPILSLTATALRRAFRHPVTLLFSARTEADVYDRGLLAYWQIRHRNLRFQYTLTREAGTGLTGRIPDILPGLFPDLSGHSVFIAGGTGFVESCLATVRSLGASDELLHTEGFFEQQQPESPPTDRLATDLSEYQAPEAG